MKRILVIFLVFTVAASGAFAIEFWLGPNAYYADVIQPEDVRNADIGALQISDFAFGGELRTYIRSVSASAVAVYLPGGPYDYTRFLIMTDIGLNIKLLFLRAGIGIGPDFGIAFTENGAVGARTGGNIRVTGDLVLGNLSLGLSWFSRVALTASDLGGATREPEGHIGISVLAKL